MTTRYLQDEINTLQETGLFRSLRRIESTPDPIVMVDGREMIMCSSNNYLGLANDPRMIDAAIRAIREFGTGSTGSRLTTGNTSLHEKLEEAIGVFKHRESALIFNTGYMANLAILSALTQQEDVILSDQFNHASIIDGVRLSKAKRLVYRHCDMNDLEEKLKQCRQYRQRWIVSDGVFSMDGDIVPLPDLLRLADLYDAKVIIDDAHATGVLGPNGAGTSDHFHLHGKVHVEMGTLSKAIGAEGGYVAGDRLLIEYLMNKARPFIFSTALSPAVVGAAVQALSIITGEPERRSRLHELILMLHRGLKAAGFTVYGSEQTAIVSVLIGKASEAVRFAKCLEEQGVFAPAIRPPTVPDDTSRIRLTLMASHTHEHVEKIVAAFQMAKQL